MKRIIYFIIACFIYTSLILELASGQTGNRTILLKPSSKNVAISVLEQSTTIISSRLKTYGIEREIVTVLTDKGQIQVQIPDNYTSTDIEGLLTIKGDLAFYETFNKKEVSDLMKSDNQLFRLLNSDPAANPADSRIGCIKTENCKTVNTYLQSIKNPVYCKFTWSFYGLKSDGKSKCLYALKTNSEGMPILGRKDIESVKSENAQDGKSYNIQITFKNSSAGLWAEATRKNINRSIAITMDNNVYSSPLVRTVIEKGVCEINGDMTLGDVNYFLALVNNPMLPVTLEIVR